MSKDRVTRALVLGGFMLLAALQLRTAGKLVVSDLNWCYPFLGADSYDWINNAMWWAGRGVVPSFRPPGLPLLLAGLHGLGIAGWFPVFNALLLLGSTVILFLLMRARVRVLPAALAAAVFLTNDFVQDLSRYLLVEISCTFFLLLSALFFELAAERPSWYAAFGAAMSVTFLFHYAAVPAGIGFAGAVLLLRPAHLRRGALWVGAAIATIVPTCWLAFRWYKTHVGVPPFQQRHDAAGLFGFAPENIEFYAVVLPALLGLALLPLYGLGAVRFVRGTGPLTATVAGPLVALSVFWLLLYRWSDKRFLFYLFPFLVVLLAEALDAVLHRARMSPSSAAACGTYLLVALGWNAIRYPSWGNAYLAVTPRDFLKARSVVGPGERLLLKLRGTTVERVHSSWRDALTPRILGRDVARAGCDLGEAERTSALRVGERLDAGLLARQAPLGLLEPASWPGNFWTESNRLSNLLGRPVVFCTYTAVCLVREPAPPLPPNSKVLGRFGPYVLTRVEPVSPPAVPSASVP